MKYYKKYVKLTLIMINLRHYILKSQISKINLPPNKKVKTILKIENLNISIYYVKAGYLFLFLILIYFFDIVKYKYLYFKIEISLCLKSILILII